MASRYPVGTKKVHVLVIPPNETVVPMKVGILHFNEAPPVRGSAPGRGSAPARGNAPAHGVPPVRGFPPAHESASVRGSAPAHEVPPARGPPPRNDARVDVAQICPWCERWALKDEHCNHVICGVQARDGFAVGSGCGRQFCFQCGLRLCGQVYGEVGKHLPNVPTQHNKCCVVEASGCGLDVKTDYCPGGHNSHCSR